MIDQSNAKKIFLFVYNSNSFEIFFLFFRQSIILREYWNDVLECIKKNIIDTTRETFSRKILESKLNYWWFWCFDDSILRLICFNCLLQLKRSKIYKMNVFFHLMFFSLMIWIWLINYNKQNSSIWFVSSFVFVAVYIKKID